MLFDFDDFGIDSKIFGHFESNSVSRSGIVTFRNIFGTDWCRNRQFETRFQHSLGEVSFGILVLRFFVWKLVCI